MTWDDKEWHGIVSDGIRWQGMVWMAWYYIGWHQMASVAWDGMR